MRKPFANSGRPSAARAVCGSMRMKKSLHQPKRKTINDRGHSPRSGRQLKAWGGASEASGTPGTRTCRALRALVERSCRDLVDGHCIMCLVLLFGQSRDFGRENKHLLIFSVSSVVN